MRILIRIPLLLRIHLIPILLIRYLLIRIPLPFFILFIRTLLLFRIPLLFRVPLLFRILLIRIPLLFRILFILLLFRFRFLLRFLLRLLFCIFILSPLLVVFDVRLRLSVIPSLLPLRSVVHPD